MSSSIVIVEDGRGEPPSALPSPGRGPRVLNAVLGDLYRRHLRRRIRDAIADQEVGRAMRLLLRLAALGDATAQYEAGFCYAHGRGVVHNMPEAVVWMRHAAAQGHADAQAFLGRLFSRGLGRVRDLNDPLRWYGTLCDEDEDGESAAARANRDLLFPAGVDIAANQEEALRWYRQAGEAGVPEAQVELARRHLTAKEDGAEPAQAFALLRSAAEQGNPDANLALARSLLHGRYQDRDPDRAVEHYRTAAEAGHPEAAYELGILHSNNQFNRFDPKEAALWLEQAAEQGHVQAQFSLAVLCCAPGMGIDDEQRAFSLFRKAAQRGHALAQLNLARFLDAGRGTTEDAFEAVIWYRKAADQDSAPAQYFLAHCLLKGRGTIADPHTAADWMRKSAERRHPAAAVDLSVLYGGKGLGEPDLPEALSWLLVAAHTGGERLAAEVARRRAEFEQRMTPEQIAEGQARAKARLAALAAPDADPPPSAG